MLVYWLVLLVVLYYAVTFNLQRRFVYPIAGSADAMAIAGSEQSKTDAQRFWLETGSGRVEALYLPPIQQGDRSRDGAAPKAPALLFAHGNGELIDPNVMLVIARCMIRNKPDSYCQAHDLETRGISELVTDLINLYSLYGFTPGTRPTHLVHRTSTAKRAPFGGRLKRLWVRIASLFRRKK